MKWRKEGKQDQDFSLGPFRGRPPWKGFDMEEFYFILSPLMEGTEGDELEYNNPFQELVRSSNDYVHIPIRVEQDYMKFPVSAALGDELGSLQTMVYFKALGCINSFSIWED